MTKPKIAKELRILAIDTGSKRMGLAVWNPQTRIATPLPFLARTQLNADIDKIKKVVADYEIEAFLVGIPYSLAGNITASTETAFFWVEKLKADFDLPVFEADESLSSKSAESELRQQGAKKQRMKVDSLSAAIFLEEFIETVEDA